MAKTNKTSGRLRNFIGRFRQRFAEAAGDRDAEAKALADLAGDGVEAKDALVAVERAHGERRDVPTEGVEVATVNDARAAADESASEHTS